MTIYKRYMTLYKKGLFSHRAMARMLDVNITNLDRWRLKRMDLKNKSNLFTSTMIKLDEILKGYENERTTK